MDGSQKEGSNFFNLLQKEEGIQKEGRGGGGGGGGSLRKGGFPTPGRNYAIVLFIRASVRVEKRMSVKQLEIVK